MTFTVFVLSANVIELSDVTEEEVIGEGSCGGNVVVCPGMFHQLVVERFQVLPQCVTVTLTHLD